MPIVPGVPKLATARVKDCDHGAALPAGSISILPTPCGGWHASEGGAPSGLTVSAANRHPLDRPQAAESGRPFIVADLLRVIELAPMAEIVVPAGIPAR